MHTLKPVDSAKAAEIAYKAKKAPSQVDKEIKLVPGLNTNFDFGNVSNFDSRSGAFFKAKSCFGFVVKGNGGRYGNDYLVSIRGTASLADALTDGNIGLQVSNTGKIVHAGFNRTFQEIQTHLAERIPPGSHVHFCGHSLGGALATLGADWAVQKKNCKVKLYTFGSPRVGFKPFCDRLTASVEPQNIYRVHRSTDVVPMVPIWPFVHVPQPGRTCKLASEGFYSPLAAHSITNYAESVAGLDWNTLITPEEIMSPQESSAAILSLAGLKTMGTTALALIGKAISYILKAAGIAVQGAFIVGFSVLDMLSLLLEKAISVSKQIGSWTTMLIEKIASLVGITINATVNLTAGLIRWVFQAMMRSLRSSINFAMFWA